MKRLELNKKCLLCDYELKTRSKDIFDTRFGIKQRWTIGRCIGCGITQTIPASFFDELTVLYEKHYNFDGEKGTNYTKFRQHLVSSKCYRLWLIIDGDISFYNVHGSGNLIDAGCNEGRGLVFYRKNGFEVEGLEPNSRAAVEARKKGFKINTRSIEDYRSNDPVDVVVLSNVIEHSLNPKEILSNISRLLKKNGQVWISCPNVNSWQRKIFNKYWINWHVPFHIFHFSKKTLFNLLKETGFQIVSEKQKSPSLWMAQSVIARLFAKPGHTTKQLRKPLLVGFLMVIIRFLLFPLLWAGNLSGRGDCLVVVAKKV